jgi:hypothetical protein
VHLHKVTLMESKLRLIAFVHNKRLNALIHFHLQGNIMEQREVHLVPYVEKHSNVHP